MTLPSFKFLAKILKVFISNQKNFLSYGLMVLPCFILLKLLDRVKFENLKKRHHFKLKFNYDRVRVQQNPFSINPFEKFCFGNWHYLPLNSIFVETRRCLDQGTEKNLLWGGKHSSKDIVPPSEKSRAKYPIHCTDSSSSSFFSL